MSGSGTGTTNTARTSGLSDWLDKTVSIITSDGRNIVGNLKGFDQTINVILEQSHERIYSEAQGVVQNVLGLYIIRGDNMYVVQGAFFSDSPWSQIFSPLLVAPQRGDSGVGREQGRHVGPEQDPCRAHQAHRPLAFVPMAL